MRITIKDLQNDPSVNTYIEKADESLTALGYTEHSFPHVTKVARDAKWLLTVLGYGEREGELAEMAGYLHDIGNVINRIEHAQSGAVMAFRILDRLNMEPDEIATIITAIGNHDEETAFPVNTVSAALIIADKCDVREGRVRDYTAGDPDIHDRVNYAVKSSEIKIENKEIILELEIDTAVSGIMEYFEIFITRMLLCRRAAERLGCRFVLIMNGQRMN